MKFPWVSREHLEDTKRVMQEHIDALDAERRELLDRLLEGAAPRRELKRVAALAEVNELDLVDAELNTAPPAEQGNTTSYTTPFDSLHSKFRNTYRGAPPAQFKARA